MPPSTPPRANPSAMTAGDLAAYYARPRPPVCGTYRAHRIGGMGRRRRAATTVLAILKSSSASISASSALIRQPVALVRRIDAPRLADRETWLADPDFVPVPVAA